MSGPHKVHRPVETKITVITARLLKGRAYDAIVRQHDLVKRPRRIPRGHSYGVGGITSPAP
jgi:hypothetical protein